MPPPLELLMFIFILFFPIAASSWIASRLTWHTPAFFLAWILNVFFGHVLTRILWNVVPSVRPFKELWVALIYGTAGGIMFGFCSGVLATVIIEDRRKRREKGPVSEDQMELE